MAHIISIIIPTFNEEKFVGKLLKCIENQTLRNFEIIVADAASSDKTPKIAKGFNAKIVSGGHQSVGRNNGAKQANGEIFLFLDADVIFSPNFLEKCYKNFIEENLDIACCYFNLRSMDIKMKMIYAIWNSSKYLRRKTKSPDGEGQCLWVKKTVFEKIKGFDEKLRVAEDTDFIHRAVTKGFKFDVLNFKFTPSDRRYKKIGIFRVFIGSLMGGITQLLGMIDQNKFSQEIYGGWGKYTR